MDIIMCGVGGQGTVLASRVLGEAAIRCGFEVRTSEIIGMAQREGAVVSQVRIGQNLNGPLIPSGCADYLLGFELAEAVRNIDKLKPHGKMLVNQQRVIPPAVYLGLSSYNENDLIGYLSDQGAEFIDGLTLARQAGHIKSVSAVILGAFTSMCRELNEKIILDELLARLPEKTRDINTRAFYLGKTYMEE